MYNSDRKELFSQDDVGPGQDLDNEAEEAGRTARDIEARMRKEKGRGPAGFDAEDLDAEEIERYYRNRWGTGELLELLKAIICHSESDY